jgi:biopolymer transport protein ExbD
VASSRNAPEGMNDVNVVPLIDVSLVLVVILMLLTPLAFEQRIAVHRAQAAAREAAREEKAERVEVAIVGEDDIRVNRSRVAREDLAATLEPMLQGPVPPAVVITCADVVSHGTFVGVLDQAKLGGAREIAITEGGD